MMETKTVTVFESDHLYNDAVPAGKLTDAISFLTAKLNEIPEQYRDSAELHIGSLSDGYGASWAEVKITYERPLTAGESEQMIRGRRMAVERREAMERATYETLKAKFG
jgi:hypothetical protein